SPVGQAHQGAFPAHEHRKGRDLPEVHVEVVSEASLGRSEHGAVVDSIPLENLSLSVIHTDRDRYDQRSPRIPQSLVNIRLKLELPGDSVQLRQSRPVEIGLKFRFSGHVWPFKLTSAGAGVRMRLKRSPIELVGDKDLAFTRDSTGTRVTHDAPLYQAGRLRADGDSLYRRPRRARCGQYEADRRGIPHPAGAPGENPAATGQAPADRQPERPQGRLRADTPPKRHLGRGGRS